MRILRICCVAMLLAGKLYGGESVQSRILDVFPESVVQMPVEERGKTVLSTSYRPSRSLWAEGLDERWVFQLEMKHEQEEYNSFALRVGKGGQIYSLRGPFGESVPPSWRAKGHLSPWNDEVWQFVAVCTKYNNGELAGKSGPYQTSYFIHNSGAYIPGDTGIKNLYCPLLASCITPDKRCYRTVNWGLVPQVRTVHRSPLLYYCQTRDVGDGVIELTWVVHNFSTRKDVVFDHLNAPWGGTRVSSLPFHYISSPDGDLKLRAEVVRNASVDVRKTGGWNLSCASEAKDSPSLALVFGRDRHLAAETKKMAEGKPYCQFRNSIYRDWRAAEPLYKKQWIDWRTRPANSFRNYDVAVIIPKFRLAPGTSIWYRSFLVVNRKDKAIELAKSLVNKVDYGLATFDPVTTPLVAVSIAQTQSRFELLARPVSGTMPLFLIKNTKTGRSAITTDAYTFVHKEKVNLEISKDHPNHDYYSKAHGYSMDKNSSDWQRLLGFGYVDQPTSGSWARLSTVIDATVFPRTDEYNLDLWVKAAGK